MRGAVVLRGVEVGDLGKGGQQGIRGALMPMDCCGIAEMTWRVLAPGAGVRCLWAYVPQKRLALLHLLTTIVT